VADIKGSTRSALVREAARLASSCTYPWYLPCWCFETSTPREGASKPTASTNRYRRVSSGRVKRYHNRGTNRLDNGME
jgi:hypothetical protein